MAVVFAVLGGVLVLLTWRSVLSVLVVPRRFRDRLNGTIIWVVAAAFRAATRPMRSYYRRDRILAWLAPTIILAQLAVWLGFFYIGFAAMLNAVNTTEPVAQAFAQAGSSLFTLGYAGPRNVPLTAIDYFAAATGLIVVALQIGYLPTLYGAYNRRETEVALLIGRAGVPAWGPEILARTRYGFAAEDDGAVMDDFYLQWERWAADVSESHTNYRVLISFRSPAKYSSWLIALLAVLDSAALWLALSPGRAPTVACRLALRQGFTTLQAIAETLGLPVDRDPDPDSDLQLSYTEYLAGVERIASTTFRMERTAEEAWPDFRGWRVNYEAVAYAIAYRLDSVPAAWSGPRRTGDAPIAPIRPATRLPTAFGARKAEKVIVPDR